MLLFAINAGMSAFYIIWTILNSSHQIVRYAQPTFLCMIAFGCIVSSTTILFLGVEDDESDGNLYYAKLTSAIDAASKTADDVLGTNSSASRPADLSCQMLPWFYSVGFVLTFAPLFTKLMRVYRIFANQSMKAIRITMPQMFGWIFGVLALDVLILAIWTSSDPIKYVREILEEDQYGHPKSSVGLCLTEDDPMPYIGAIMGFHILVLLVGNYLAYKTREVGTAFSESKYISIAMVSNLQVLALSIPVLIIVADNATSNFFVRAGVIFLNDFTVLNLIFLPKFLDVTLGLNILGTDIKSVSGTVATSATKAEN